MAIKVLNDFLPPAEQVNLGAVKVGETLNITEAGTITPDQLSMTTDGPEYITTDDVTSTYLSTGTQPVNGTAVASALTTKQNVLVSGGNIKTINNQSIVGSGNLDVDGLPSQSGQSGKFLTTNGTAASWTNITADSEIEWATYGTTTWQQINNWNTAEKTVLCLYSDIIYYLANVGATNAYFSHCNIFGDKGIISEISVTTSNVWSHVSKTMQPQIPAGTSGNIVTYTGTAGSLSSATINDIVPTQSGQSGKVLTTNGTAVSWTNFPAVDQTYSGTSTNAQSGVAVKSAIDTAISSVYKPAGSTTFANKPALSSSIEGYVYNISDAFTTTSDFVEGAGKSYPAGTNIVCINTATSGTAVYKWDVLAGFVDLSGYQTLITSTNKLSSDLIDDTNKTNKFVTTAEKSTWNSKQDQLVSGTNIKTINNTSLLGSGNIDTHELPSQTSQSGKFLTTNGTTVSWANIPTEVEAYTAAEIETLWNSITPSN